jgi:stage V sporulation protein G
MQKKSSHETERPHNPALVCLQVTNAQIFPLKELHGKTRAMVRVVLNDQFQLTGLRVIEGANGLFVSYPNDPSYKGDEYKNLFYPMTRELREHIEGNVLEKYQSMMHASLTT